jgi:iron complex outermembrane receptor protein
MKKILLLFLLNISALFGQKEVSGIVTDSAGSPLPGVNIIEKGTRNGVSTDNNGVYKIEVEEGATLVFSYVGFSNIEKLVKSNKIDIVLTEDSGQSLEEVFVTGTRTAARSNTTSALPIDVLSSKDLTSTGQATFDKALQYKIPSFNTVQTPVNDATSLLDPYEIRNLGPSRTLILINGKRKNMSALLYTQTSPGRGETGADISAIPTDAIERVEILRDGASAQYGSDAIAGVMNIILKKNSSGGQATLRTGITGKGDGEMYGISINNGTIVGEKGFLNYTIDFSKVNLANRPGILSAEDEADYWGVDLATTQAFLDIKPDGGNVNGSPETSAAKFEINGGSDLSEKTELYYNAAYVYKKVNSFANYRAPYWRTVTDYPYLASLFGDGTDESYLGYAPTFIGDLNDYNATLGFKNVSNGWNTDASVTIGGNKQVYGVTNSHNRSTYNDLSASQLAAVGGIEDHSGTDFVYANDPTTYTGQTSFSPGGTSFSHLVGNIDVSKIVSSKISFAFGSEFRTENFEIIAGDLQSYIGLGADSFQGNAPENSGTFNRYNIGFYADAAIDFTQNFLVNATVRHEEYSDFGAANVWKLSSRYKFYDDKFTLRGSLSTGFRAPSLHQIYTEKSQSTFSGGAIAVTGIVSNVSTTARSLGVPSLTAEKSENTTLGLGLRPSKNFNLTVDYYNIKVNDRIVLGNLIDNVAYFVNAIDSRTSGLDFVSNYKNIPLGPGTLGLSLSGNYTLINKRIGAVKNPESAGTETVFNATQEALMFTSRPKFKYIFGGDYELKKFIFSVNNTVFGPTKFKNADYSDAGLSTVFETKLVTDLGINYNATKKISLTFNINNLFNVLPKFNIKSDGSASAEAIINDPSLLHDEWQNITFDGRYSTMSYDGYQFSQLGIMWNLSMIYRL